MEQADLLRRVIDVLEDQRIVYLLVGSLASSVYGEPRLTADVDVVVELNLPQAAKLCAAFPAPEYYVSETAASQAVARGGQFNVIHPASGNKIDFIIARTDASGALPDRSSAPRAGLAEPPRLHGGAGGRDPRKVVVLPRRRFREAPP